MGYTFPVVAAALWAATLLLPTTADRLRGALGLPAFLLGAASVPHLPAFQGPSPSVWISAALLLLGPAMLLLASWRARELLHPVIALGSVVAAAAALAAAWPVLRQGGVLPAIATAGAIGLGAWSAWLAGALSGLGRVIRRRDAGLAATGRRRVVHLLVAAALGTQLAALAWPLWVLSWQPIGVGAGLLALGWAAAAGRPRLALAAAALAASFAAVDQLNPGWIALAAAALAPRSRPWFIAGLAPVGAYLAIPVLLGAEALLTVLLVAFATVLLAVLAGREAAAPAESR